MLTQIEKKHSHVSKKLLTWILYDTQILISIQWYFGWNISLLEKIPLRTFISETIGRKSMPSSNHVQFYCRCVLYNWWGEFNYFGFTLAIFIIRKAVLVVVMLIVMLNIKSLKQVNATKVSIRNTKFDIY